MPRDVGTHFPEHVTAGESVWFGLRKRHVSGDLVTNGNTTRVDVKIIGNGTETVDATTVGTIHASLQTGDDRWPDNCNEDATEKGFNFEYTAPTTAFPSAGLYEVEFSVLATTGTVTKFVRRVPVRSKL